MESEDREPIFTKRLLLIILFIILIVLIILFLLRGCGNGNGGNEIINEFTINPSSVTMKPNDSQTLYAEVDSDQSINWIVSDPNCVTISPIAGKTKEVVITSGNLECETNIKASVDDMSTDVKVVVRKEADLLTGLKLNKTKYSVKVGETVLAATTAVPTTAELPVLVYSIGNTKIATVNENGVIKGISAGTTTLTVTSKNNPSIKATATVQVTSSSNGGNNNQPKTAAITGIEFNSNNAKEVCAGKSIKLAYNLKPSNTTEKNVTWTLDNTNYAKIDSNGNLTGVKAGTVKVTLASKTNSKVTATTNIKVLASTNSKCSSGGNNGGNGGNNGGNGGNSGNPWNIQFYSTCNGSYASTATNPCTAAKPPYVAAYFPSGVSGGTSFICIGSGCDPYSGTHGGSNYAGIKVENKNATYNVCAGYIYNGVNYGKYCGTVNVVYSDSGSSADDLKINCVAYSTDDNKKVNIEVTYSGGSFEAHTTATAIGSGSYTTSATGTHAFRVTNGTSQKRCWVYITCKEAGSGDSCNSLIASVEQEK